MKKIHLKGGFFLCYFFSILQVLMPKIVYKGQKLIKLVIKKTAANTSNTIPKTPEIVPVKYKTATAIANKIRTNLSVPPIFFFIKKEFKLSIKLIKKSQKHRF